MLNNHQREKLENVIKELGLTATLNGIAEYCDYIHKYKVGYHESQQYMSLNLGIQNLVNKYLQGG